MTAVIVTGVFAVVVALVQAVSQVLAGTRRQLRQIHQEVEIFRSLPDIDGKPLFEEALNRSLATYAYRSSDERESRSKRRSDTVRLAVGSILYFAGPVMLWTALWPGGLDDSPLRWLLAIGLAVIGIGLAAPAYSRLFRAWISQRRDSATKEALEAASDAGSEAAERILRDVYWLALARATGNDNDADVILPDGRAVEFKTATPRSRRERRKQPPLNEDRRPASTQTTDSHTGTEKRDNEDH